MLRLRPRCETVEDDYADLRDVWIPSATCGWALCCLAGKLFGRETLHRHWLGSECTLMERDVGAVGETGVKPYQERIHAIVYAGRREYLEVPES